MPVEELTLSLREILPPWVAVTPEPSPSGRPPSLREILPSWVIVTPTPTPPSTTLEAPTSSQPIAEPVAREETIALAPEASALAPEPLVVAPEASAVALEPSARRVRARFVLRGGRGARAVAPEPDASAVAAPAAGPIPSSQEVPDLPPWATAHRSAATEEAGQPIPVKPIAGVWTILMEQATLTSWEEPAAQAPQVSPPPADDGPPRLDD